MILGPKIETCAPGRHCRYFTCRAPVRYRVLVVTDRKKSEPFHQSLYYCAEHAEKWAKAQNMTLPEWCGA